MNKRWIGTAAFCTGIGTLAVSGYRAVAATPGSPQPLYYSGTLAEAGRELEGKHSITVSLYENTDSQDALCEHTEASADVHEGRFRIDVSECAETLREHQAAFVGVRVVTQDGTHHDFARTAVAAVPYALSARRAAVAASAESAAGALQSALENKVDRSELPIISEWKAFDLTTTVSIGSGPLKGSRPELVPSKCHGRYRRVGDSIDVSFHMTLKSPLWNTQLDFGLPDGFVIDDAKAEAGDDQGFGASIGGGHIRTTVDTATAENTDSATVTILGTTKRKAVNGDPKTATPAIFATSLPAGTTAQPISTSVPVDCFVAHYMPSVECLAYGGGWIADGSGHVSEINLHYTVPVRGWTVSSK